MILMFKPWLAPSARTAVVIVLAGALATLAGCTAAEPATSPSTGSTKPRVVVGLYPYEFVVEQVGSGLVDIVNLTAPGAEPHDLELTAKQVAEVGQADLVVFQRGLQPAFDAAVDQSNAAHVVDIMTVVSFTEGDPEETEGPATGLDPHVWLDTDRMASIAVAISQVLGEIDPVRAVTYANNANNLYDRLIQLDADYREGLADCTTRAFITTHAAFGYLAAKYNLIQVPLTGLAPDAEPTPAWLARVQQLAAEYAVTTIFTEPLTSADPAETLADDLGLMVDVLDPIEGITEDSLAADYLGLMTTNLEGLMAANGCS
jgi:zinc transport system substrate-binding protein